MKTKTMDPATMALFFAISLRSKGDEPSVKDKNIGTVPMALSITNRFKKAREKSPEKEDN